MYIFIVRFERWRQVGFRLFCPQRIFKKASHNHSFTYRIHTQNSGRGNFVLQILLFSVCLLLNLLANKLRAKLRHSKRINEGPTRIYSICGTKLFVLKGLNSTFRRVLNGHILRFQSAFNRQPTCPDWTSNQQSADFWLHQQKKPDLYLKKVSPHTLELWQRTFCPQRTRAAFILYCYFVIRSLLRWHQRHKKGQLNHLSRPLIDRLIRSTVR